MLRALSSLWRRPAPITDRAGLRDFLKAESAFLAQKSTIEYCRARAGMNWDKLFREAAFAEALEICRWEAMAAVLADMLIVTEGFLRPHLDDAEAVDRMGASLSAMFSEILESYEEASAARGGWDDLIGEFPARIARVQLGPPHDAAQVAKTAGARLFELLPIHRTLRAHDREMVVNNVRFGMVAFYEKLGQAVPEPAALARDLAAATPEP
jgi:hypothetical protein